MKNQSEKSKIKKNLENGLIVKFVSVPMRSIVSVMKCDEDHVIEVYKCTFINNDTCNLRYVLYNSVSENKMEFMYIPNVKLDDIDKLYLILPNLSSINMDDTYTEVLRKSLKGIDEDVVIRYWESIEVFKSTDDGFLDIVECHLGGFMKFDSVSHVLEIMDKGFLLEYNSENVNELSDYINDSDLEDLDNLGKVPDEYLSNHSMSELDKGRAMTNLMNGSVMIIMSDHFYHERVLLAYSVCDWVFSNVAYSVASAYSDSESPDTYNLSINIPFIDNNGRLKFSSIIVYEVENISEVLSKVGYLIEEIKSYSSINSLDLADISFSILNLDDELAFTLGGLPDVISEGFTINSIKIDEE